MKKFQCCFKSWYEMDAFNIIWSGVIVPIEPILAIVDHQEKPDLFSFFFDRSGEWKKKFFFSNRDAK